MKQQEHSISASAREQVGKLHIFTLPFPFPVPMPLSPDQLCNRETTAACPGSLLPYPADRIGLPLQTYLSHSLPYLSPPNQQVRHGNPQAASSSLTGDRLQVFTSSSVPSNPIRQTHHLLYSRPPAVNSPLLYSVIQHRSPAKHSLPPSLPYPSPQHQQTFHGNLCCWLFFSSDSLGDPTFSSQINCTQRLILNYKMSKLFLDSFT